MPGSSLTLERRDPIGQRFESVLPKHCYITHKHELIYTTNLFIKIIWINISTQQLGIYTPITYSALFPWCPICVLLYSKSRVSPRLILRDQARQIVFPMGRRGNLSLSALILMETFHFLRTQVKHVFKKYPSGVRYVEFTHGGKDTKFWAGHYGVKMTNSGVFCGKKKSNRKKRVCINSLSTNPHTLIKFYTGGF